MSATKETSVANMRFVLIGTVLINLQKTLKLPSLNTFFGQIFIVSKLEKIARVRVRVQVRLHHA